MAKRPLAITLICILFAIVGLVGLIGGIWKIIDTGADPDMVVSVIISVVMLIVIYGLWTGIKVFWYLGVIFAVIDIISSAYSMIVVGGVNDSIVVAIISLIVFLYLLKSNVRSYFKI